MAKAKRAAAKNIAVNESAPAVGTRSYGVGQIVSVKGADGQPIGGQKGLNADGPLIIHGIANKNMEDRYREVLSPVGCDTRNFMLNPVLLAHHSYYCPIGQVTMVEAREDGVHFEAWIGDPSKAPLTPMQQEVRSLVAQGILKAVSVGFLPHKIKEAVFTPEGALESPTTIEQWELLELSIVAVPCNPESVFDMKHMGMNSQLLVDLVKTLGNATMENAPQKQPTEAQKTVEQIKAELAQSELTVQALIFSKSKFSAESAGAWSKAHGFLDVVSSEDTETLCVQQKEKSDFETETFQSIALTEGVQAVAGKIKTQTQEGGQAMEEMIKQLLEMMTAQTEALKAIQAKLESKEIEETEETETEETPPPAVPAEDEGKALKAAVEKMGTQISQLSEIVTHLVQKQR